MPIKAETNKTSENQWYDDLESIARCWEELANTLGGTSTGVYNHFLVNFEIEIPTNNKKKLLIKGEKKLNNISTGLSLKPSTYSQVIEFEIENPSNHHEFVLKKDMFLNSFFNLFKSYQNSKVLGDYKLRYNSNSILHNFSEDEILKIKKLDQITFSNDKLYMKVFNLTNDVNNAKWIVDFFLKLIQVSVVFKPTT